MKELLKALITPYKTKINTPHIWYIGPVIFSVVLLLTCSIHTPLNDMDPSLCIDIEGNVYKTVQIGNQIWMAENLRTTTFNDKVKIPYINNNGSPQKQRTPGHSYYANELNLDSIKKYGMLYNWYAVNTKKLAPKGWRIPSQSDWEILENYLIEYGFNWDGTRQENKFAKSLASQTGWDSSNTEGAIGHNRIQNNIIGFNGYPAGYHSLNNWFYLKGQNTFYWSSTEYDSTRAIYSSLYFDVEYLLRDYYHKGNGYSVRLIKE